MMMMMMMMMMVVTKTMMIDDDYEGNEESIVFARVLPNVTGYDCYDDYYYDS